MITPELQRLIQVLSNDTGAAIDQTFRALRARGLVPTSPRGGQPVAVQAEHAAWALLTLAIDRTADKAADVVAEWAEMRPRDGRTVFVTFGHALASILSDTGARLLVREIRIGREWPLASIIVGDAEGTVSHAFGTSPAGGDYRATPIRSEYVISGGALHQIAIDLADAAPAAEIAG